MTKKNYTKCLGKSSETIKFINSTILLFRCSFQGVNNDDIYQGQHPYLHIISRNNNVMLMNGSEYKNVSFIYRAPPRVCSGDLFIFSSRS